MRAQRILSLILLTVPCIAQQVVAPSPEQAGPIRGDDWHGYNILNSFESGYRFNSIGGNSDTYRSTENLGNGVRLLSNLLTVNSRNGHGTLFDELILTSEGLGGDPNSTVNLRLQKNRLYQYSLQWRRSEYFNPGLVSESDQRAHLLDTSYTLQDHDVTLFPQSNIRVFLGYTRDTQGGAGLSTVQLFSPSSQFDATGNVFPLFTNVKRLQNEYRLGVEARWLGFTMNLTHGWEDFKDDTRDQFSGSSTGDSFNSNTFLTLFGRDQPNHGTSPFWRVFLVRNSHWFDFNGRFTYRDGVRAFLDNENALGTNRFGALANQQIVNFGSARRPVTTGNVNLTVFPTTRLSITESASLYEVRTDGTSAYLQLDNATQLASLLFYQYLGIRTDETETDAIYRLYKWLDLHGGYEYSNRRITSSPQFDVAGTATSRFSQTNELNAGIFGFRLRPLNPLTISLDGEVGRSNRPFAPRSDKDYSTFNARIQYKRKSLQFIAWARSDYNENSITISAYSSHSRNYSASAAWSPRNWLSFDTTYSKLHVDTLGGTQFFVNSQLLANQSSFYVSNLHSGTLGIRLGLVKRADLYVGYNRVQDTGDGRSAPGQTTVRPAVPAFQAAQTFPLVFQSPLARISVRISERLRWNAGYQYFGYHADFPSVQDYLAHTGYSSLSWSF